MMRQKVAFISLYLDLNPTQMRPIFFIFACLVFTSCATAFSPNKATAYQKRKPAYGQPRRELRIGYVALDVVCLVLPLFVDFATGKIYKASPTTTRRK